MVIVVELGIMEKPEIVLWTVEKRKNNPKRGCSILVMKSISVRIFLKLSKWLFFLVVHFSSRPLPVLSSVKYLTI